MSTDKTTNPVTINAEAGTPFIEVIREFEASPARVFRAHTDPDLVVKWLGPRGYQMDLTEYDARSGGAYRYVHSDSDGNEYAFHGVFHTVVENERITQTFEFEGWPGQVSLETLTLEDLGDGRTRLRSWSTYPSVEARDGMVSSGMETGLTQGYEQMDELLAAESSE